MEKIRIFMDMRLFAAPYVLAINTPCDPTLEFFSLLKLNLARVRPEVKGVFALHSTLEAVEERIASAVPTGDGGGVKRLHTHQRSDRESGMVLVAVLWTMVLLGMLAAALVAMSRSDARNVSLDRDQLQARENVQAGINLAIVALTDPSQHWPVDGTQQTITFDKVPVVVAVTSESGKIDLNNADPDLIRGLLTAVGEGPGAADEITNEIIAQRESGGFTNMAEILQLPGVSGDLYDRLAPNLTLYSGSSSVDPSTGSIDVLLAIPGNTRADAEAEMARRTSPDSLLDGPNRPLMAGQTYTLKGKYGVQGGIVATEAETVRLTGDSRRPIFLLQSR